MPRPIDLKFSRLKARAAIWQLLLALVPAAALLGADSPNELEQISLQFADPCLNRRKISTELGGVIKGQDFHFEAHRLEFWRDPHTGKAGLLIAEQGVYVQYSGARFVGQRLEFDFAKRQGILQMARSQLGSWLVGSCEVHLFPDGRSEFRHPWAISANAPFADWRLRAAQLTLLPNQDVAVTGLEYMLGNRVLARVKKLQFNAKKLQQIPFQIGYQWGSKDQKRIGLTYRFSKGTCRAQVNFDRWYTQGWGLGFQARDQSPHFSWSTGHYALLEQRPHPHWRFSSSAALNRDWEGGTRLEGRLHFATDKSFVNQRRAKSLIYRPSRISYLMYRHLSDSAVVTLCAVPKINSYDAVKQLLPSAEVFARPVHIARGWIFDQSLNAGYLRLSYPKSSRVPPFATGRSIYRGSLYKSYSPGPGLVATAMIQARAYGVSQTPAGNSYFTCQPRWDGHLQMACRNRIFDLAHQFSPYLHHTASGGERRSKLYVFDLEEALPRVQRLEWGARGYLRGDRELMNYRLSFAHPLADRKILTRAFIASLDCHVNRRLDLGGRAELDCRSWRLGRLTARASTTLTRSIALVAEYDRRGIRAWRGIGEDREELERRHSPAELLSSFLSDQREYLSGSIYWRLEPDWVVRAQVGRAFNRVSGGARQKNYTECGLIAMTVLPSAWKVQLSCQHRSGKIRFYLDLSGSPRAASITKRTF